jgi:hypothetical protein
MLSEDQLDMNEIFVFRADEWNRLFEWCDFLLCRDGAFELYAPLVDTLRRYFVGIDQPM